MTRLLLLAIFLPGLAWANPYKDNLDDAAESLEDAVSATRKGPGRCKAMVPSLNKAIDDLESVRRGTTDRRLGEIQAALTGLQTASAQARCPGKVTERIGRAMSSLVQARAAAEDDGDRRDRRHRHDDDDDDQPAAPPPPQPVRVEAALGDLRVVYGERVNGELGVKVLVSSASLRGIGRTPFYFGGRIRPEGGDWADWLTSPQYSAPTDPYSWNNVYTQWFPATLLRATDRGGGRFVARLSLFDANRNELAFKEVTIDLVGGPNQPGPQGPPPPPSGAPRDCGTGQDPGCSMQRNGSWAMDRDTFRGFYDSIRNTPSDLTRKEMCGSVLAANWLTALQLGMVLEVFGSDLIRFDVARMAAPHLVNPAHALGLTSKFRGSMLQRDFTQLISEQR